MLLDSLDVTTTCELLFIMERKKCMIGVNFKVSLNCFDKISGICKLSTQEKKRYSFICSKCSLITYLDFTIVFPKDTLVKSFEYKRLEDGDVILTTVRPLHPQEILKMAILTRRQQQLF